MFKDSLALENLELEPTKEIIEAQSLLMLMSKCDRPTLNLTDSTAERDLKPVFYDGLLSQEESEHVTSLMNPIFSNKEITPRVSITTVFSKKIDSNMTLAFEAIVSVFSRGNIVSFYPVYYPDYGCTMVSVTHRKINNPELFVDEIQNYSYPELFDCVQKILSVWYSKKQAPSV